MLRTFFFVLLAAVCCAQQSTAPTALDLVKQGVKLNFEGKQDDALALYRQALEISPDLYEAHLESGIALDLKGNYTEARQHFAKAIEVAPAASKQQALRAMAMSYAFEGNANELPNSSKRFSTRVILLMITSGPLRSPTNSPASILNRVIPPTPTSGTNRDMKPRSTSPISLRPTRIFGSFAGRMRRLESPPAAAKPTKLNNISPPPKLL